MVQPNNIRAQAGTAQGLEQRRQYAGVGLSFGDARMDETVTANPKRPIVDTTIGLHRQRMPVLHHHEDGLEEAGKEDVGHTEGLFDRQV